MDDNKINDIENDARRLLENSDDVHVKALCENVAKLVYHYHHKTSNQRYRIETFENLLKNSIEAQSDLLAMRPLP